MSRHSFAPMMRTLHIQVRLWTGIRRIFLIRKWTAESLLNEKLLVFINNFLLLSILKGMGNFYFALTAK